MADLGLPAASCPRQVTNYLIGRILIMLPFPSTAVDMLAVTSVQALRGSGVVPVTELGLHTVDPLTLRKRNANRGVRGSFAPGMQAT